MRLYVFNTLCGTVSELWVTNGFFLLKVMVLFLAMWTCLILLQVESAFIYKSVPAVSGEQRKRRHSSSQTSKLYWQFTLAPYTTEISIVALVLLNSGLNWWKQLWDLALGASKVRLCGEQLMNRCQAGVCWEMHICPRNVQLALAQPAPFRSHRVWEPLLTHP